MLAHEEEQGVQRLVRVLAVQVQVAFREKPPGLELLEDLGVQPAHEAVHVLLGKLQLEVHVALHGLAHELGFRVGVVIRQLRRGRRGIRC